MIFNIQKCSIHDGAGLRTLVFFKGCPLRCLWCANPESQSYKAEIMEFPSKCIGCGFCRKECKVGAIKEDGRIDRAACTGCFKCVDACYAESRKIAGEEYTVDELFKEIDKDRLFYETRGGGVTFSGGEPLTQPEYLAEIAARCKKSNISVNIESCGYGKYDEFKKALPYIDAMFMDIKQIDSGKHKEMTGFGNELILDNIKKISEFGVPITIRTPVVPGYTDSPDNIEGIAKFICDLPSVSEYELLPYHRLGESKYAALGRDYLLKGLEPPADQQMNDFVSAANRILKARNKKCFWTKDNNKMFIEQ